MIRLHELREKRGLSMMDTAKSLDMPYTTYVNYEKGTREPNIEALFRLADFFEVTIDELLERCAPNEPLTLDELREMDGEPVWVTPLGFWALVIAKPGKRVQLISNDGETVWADKEIELVGPIYRRPPERQEDT